MGVQFPRKRRYTQMAPNRTFITGPNPIYIVCVDITMVRNYTLKDLKEFLLKSFGKLLTITSVRKTGPKNCFPVWNTQKYTSRLCEENEQDP